MKILVVCYGNTCRSPMLMYMLKDYLKSQGREDIEVDSAGLMYHFKPISEQTKRVLEFHGIPFGTYVSKPVDEHLLANVDYVFTMSEEYAAMLRRMCSKPVLSLGAFAGADIDDPYGKGDAAYDFTYYKFFPLLDKIVGYIDNAK